MFSKADLGLGDTSEVISSPTPEPIPTMIMAPPPPLHAEIDSILPPVDEAPTQDAKEAPARGGDNEASGDDTQLCLVGPEIPSGEPILPPPSDCSRLPIALFVHVGRASGQHPNNKQQR